MLCAEIVNKKSQEYATFYRFVYYIQVFIYPV